MEYTMKQRLLMIVMIVVYIVLGVAGIYTTSLIFLFPFLAAPLTLYLLRYQPRTQTALIVQLGIILGIVVSTGNIFEAILYGIGVVLPSYLFVKLYQSNTPLPHIVMYVGVGTVGAFYLYIVGMQSIGIDYIQYYLAFLEEYQSIQMQLVDQMVQGMPVDQAQEIVTMFRDVVGVQVLVLQTIYPALTLVLGIILATIQVVMITLVGKIKRWPMQSLRQFGNFTFARKMGFLLLLAILCMQITGNNSGSFIMLGTNLFFFVSSLLEILGFIVLVMLIRRRVPGRGMKVLLSFGVILVMMTAPVLFGGVGIADTVFNFRKSKIIV